MGNKMTKKKVEELINAMKEEYPEDYEKRLGFAIAQSTDEEAIASIGICVLSTLENNPDQEDMLISVCGYGLESLLNRMRQNEFDEEYDPR